jgi:rhodanese-related sulfurtransferase
MFKKPLYSVMSLTIALGLLLTGCGQTKPAATTPAPASTPAPAAEDSAKVVKDAVTKYFNNIPTVGDSYKIAEAKLKEELEKNPDKYVVFDIRKADAYAKGHIKGAINVPFGKDIADNLEKMRAVAKDKTAIVACYTGQTAGQTDSLLNIAGINTRSLNFGMGMDGFEKGWLALKYPVVTDAAPMPNAPAVESPSKAIDQAVKDYFTKMGADSYKIDLPQLKDAIAKTPDQYLIVDVRQKKDFDAGHIKGAINVPYGPDLAKELDNLKTKAQGKTMVVYCYTGQTAGQADSLFNVAGIKTLSLNFGFGTDGFSKGWKVSFPSEIVK